MGELVYLLGRDAERFAGGAEQYGLAHCFAAARGGYWPQWYSFGRETESVEMDYGMVHRLSWFGTNYRPEFAAFYRHRMARAVVERLSRSDGPHVIHSFGMWISAGALATRELRERGVEVKHVASCFELILPHSRAKLENSIVRDSWTKYAKNLFIYELVKHSAMSIERQAMRESDSVIVNYDRLRDLILRDYDPAINVVKLPYAAATAFAPLDAASELPRPIEELPFKDGPLLLSTSRHMPRKGVDVLIRALARVRDDGHDFRAALVGIGQLLESHRQLIGELGLADRVALPGRVPTVGAYLRHADIFCLPSLAEGSGSMSVLEALQYGVPVVSSAVDGMTEDLTDDVDSLLVRTGSVEELHQALNRLISDRAARQRIALNGYDLYRARFSAEAAGSALCEYYAELGLEPTRF